MSNACGCNSGGAAMRIVSSEWILSTDDSKPKVTSEIPALPQSMRIASKSAILFIKNRIDELSMSFSMVTNDFCSFFYFVNCFITVIANVRLKDAAAAYLSSISSICARFIHPLADCFSCGIFPGRRVPWALNLPFFERHSSFFIFCFGEMTR